MNAKQDQAVMAATKAVAEMSAHADLPYYKGKLARHDELVANVKARRAELVAINEEIEDERILSQTFTVKGGL